jgi:hypothetical protein
MPPFDNERACVEGGPFYDFGAVVSNYPARTRSALSGRSIGSADLAISATGRCGYIALASSLRLARGFLPKPVYQEERDCQRDTERHYAGFDQAL